LVYISSSDLSQAIQRPRPPNNDKSTIDAPGAGKGTLCKRLAQAFSLKHLSFGDLLRQVTSSPPSGDVSSDAHEAVCGYAQRGELLPTEMLFSFLEPELVKSPSSTKHPSDDRPVLLDGLPHQLDHCKQFEHVVRPSTPILC